MNNILALKRLTLALLIMLVPEISRAQRDLLLYNFSGIGEVTNNNPSCFPEFSVYVGIPALSGIHFSGSHSGFVYHDLYKLRQDDSVLIDVDNALSKMKSKNYLSYSAGIDLLSFGFRVKNNYFHANITEKAWIKFAYPKELMDLVANGNGNYTGQFLDFSKTGFDASHYREYAIGYARKINDRWNAGLRLKYLYGMENASTTAGNLGFATAADDYTLSIPTDIVINTSTLANSDEGYDPLTDGNGSESSRAIRHYLTGMKNRGFALDLGGTFQMDETWNFSASILDIGAIRWKENTRNYKTGKGEYSFGGIDLEDFISDDSNGQSVLDSLGNTFTTDETYSPYTERLPVQAYLGSHYNLNDKSFIAATLHGEFFKRTLQPAASIAYHRKVGNHFAFQVAWSYINHDFLNAGAGWWVYAGPVQFYIMTENAAGTLAPLDHTHAQVHFGFNLIWGRPKHDRDKDGTPDRKDRCPETPGPALLLGCPDSDGDSIPDIDDKCPGQKGVAKFMGCPDRDHDDVVDSLDLCPDEPGLPEYRGCPDTDGDSIPDLADSCKTEKGLAINNGCPDTDGDGVIDKNDSCLLVPGPASNHGCPVIEKEPEKPAGPVQVQLSQEEQEVINKVFSNLEFETGKSLIRKSSYPALDQLADLLQKKPAYSLIVEGHTDNTGSALLNLKLSQQRADAVKVYLQQKGISGDRITSRGFGMTRPVASNSTSEGRQRNRRVEFTVVE